MSGNEAAALVRSYESGGENYTDSETASYALFFAKVLEGVSPTARIKRDLDEAEGEGAGTKGEAVAYRYWRLLHDEKGVWSFLTATDAARVGIAPAMEPLYGAEMVLALRQELSRFKDERSYVVGCNDGYAAAEEHFKSGVARLVENQGELKQITRERDQAETRAIAQAIRFAEEKHDERERMRKLERLLGEALSQQPFDDSCESWAHEARAALAGDTQAGEQ